MHCEIDIFVYTRILKEHIYIAVSRHLAAHCPTRRAESQMTRTAIRLHRGDPLYEEI